MPWGGEPNWHDELVEADSREAYRNALAFAMTGDAAYAATVKRILAAWMAHIPGAERIANNNAPLELGWALGNMLKALLVLERSGEGLTPAEKQRALAWLDEVSHEHFHAPYLFPSTTGPNVCAPRFDVSLARQAKNRADYGCNAGGVYLGNWQTTILETRMLLALYRGGARGKAEYREALRYALFVLERYTQVRDGRALTAETCRDLYHAGFGIAGLVEMAELAWQQGDPDLYTWGDARLARIVEFHAGISRGEIDDDAVGCEEALVARDNVQPFHEVAYNHYNGRMGMQLPATERVVWSGTRDGPADGAPDGLAFDSYTLQWGYGTITHRETACR
jgi:hypothetical protein